MQMVYALWRLLVTFRDIMKTNRKTTKILCNLLKKWFETELTYLNMFTTTYGKTIKI